MVSVYYKPLRASLIVSLGFSPRKEQQDPKVRILKTQPASQGLHPLTVLSVGANGPVSPNPRGRWVLPMSRLPRR